MNNIIVIDNGNIIFRAIMSCMNRENAHAPYTYMMMVCGYLKRLKIDPVNDIVFIAEDAGRSWRKEKCKTYKAQRKELREGQRPPEWWNEQFRQFNELMDKIRPILPWNFLRIWTMEADDFGAVIAKRYSKTHNIILCTSDGDWTMLVHYPNVKIWSPISKKFKEVPNPLKVLMEKINGKDISDNLTEKPSSEYEWEIRKMIVNLLELPKEIEDKCNEEIDKQIPKNLVLHKVPFTNVRKSLRQIYN